MLSIALSGGVVLEEALDLSSDRLLMIVRRNTGKRSIVRFARIARKYSLRYVECIRLPTSDAKQLTHLIKHNVENIFVRFVQCVRCGLVNAYARSDGKEGNKTYAATG